jgi:hypothetical protein
MKSAPTSTWVWAPVAQLDRASDYGSEGWGFESLRARRVAKSPCTAKQYRDFIIALLRELLPEFPSRNREET